MSEQNKGYWIRSGTYTILQRSSMLLFGVGSFMLLVRMLSKEDFGIWSLFLSIATLFEVARNGLIQNALIKFLNSHEEDNHASIISASFYLNLLLTLISLVLIYFLADLSVWLFETEKIKPLFYWYIIMSVLLVPFSQFEFLQQANFVFKGIFLSTFIRQGIFFFWIVIYFLMKWEISLVNLIVSQIISLLIGTLVSYFFTRYFLRFDPRISTKWIGELFRYGKYVFGTNISGKIFSSIDQVMLGSMISTGAVAIYNTAIRITMLVDVPTTAAAQVVFPQSARLANANDKIALRLLYEKSVAVILIFLIPFAIGVFIFPKLIIMIIAGEEYYDTIGILQVTILYSVLIPFTRQSGTIWDSMGFPKFSFYYTFASAVLNIVFNYVFIVRFGVIGAAYGTFASYMVGFVVTLIVMRRMLDARLWSILKYVWYYVGYTIDLIRRRITPDHSAKTR